VRQAMVAEPTDSHSALARSSDGLFNERSLAVYNTGTLATGSSYSGDPSKFNHYFLVYRQRQAACFHRSRQRR